MTTKQTQHTPGPWKYELMPFGIINFADAGNFVFGSFQVVSEQRSKHEANAHLIAAAPELLEALKFMAERAETGTFVTNGDLIACRAAIAKAEGVKS